MAAYLWAPLPGVALPESRLPRANFLNRLRGSLLAAAPDYFEGGLGTGNASLGAMNLSIIAFGVMTVFVVLFAVAIFLMERSSSRVEFPKSDLAETEDDNPFKVAD
jgi:hypothetical protein